MQFSAVLLPLLPALALATPAASATSATPSASCVYSALPTATAYAAEIPNPQLTAAKIQKYFENFSFACKPGKNFTAYIESTVAYKPWFGGDVQISSSCDPNAFAGLINFAMQDGGNNGSYHGTCLQYKGETGTPFKRNAGKYFATLK